MSVKGTSKRELISSKMGYNLLQNMRSTNDPMTTDLKKKNILKIFWTRKVRDGSQNQYLERYINLGWKKQTNKQNKTKKSYRSMDSVSDRREHTLETSVWKWHELFPRTAWCQDVTLSLTLSLTLFLSLPLLFSLAPSGYYERFVDSQFVP